MIKNVSADYRRGHSDGYNEAKKEVFCENLESTLKINFEHFVTTSTDIKIVPEDTTNKQEGKIKAYISAKFNEFVDTTVDNLNKNVKTFTLSQKQIVNIKNFFPDSYQALSYQTHTKILNVVEKIFKTYSNAISKLSIKQNGIPRFAEHIVAQIICYLADCNSLDPNNFDSLILTGIREGKAANIELKLLCEDGNRMDFKSLFDLGEAYNQTFVGSDSKLKDSKIDEDNNNNIGKKEKDDIDLGEEKTKQQPSSSGYFSSFYPFSKPTPQSNSINSEISNNPTEQPSVIEALEQDNDHLLGELNNNPTCLEVLHLDSNDAFSLIGFKRGLIISQLIMAVQNDDKNIIQCLSQEIKNNMIKQADINIPHSLKLFPAYGNIRSDYFSAKKANNNKELQEYIGKIENFCSQKNVIQKYLEETYLKFSSDNIDNLHINPYINSGIFSAISYLTKCNIYIWKISNRNNIVLLPQPSAFDLTLSGKGKNQPVSSKEMEDKSKDEIKPQTIPLTAGIQDIHLLYNVNNPLKRLLLKNDPILGKKDWEKKKSIENNILFSTEPDAELKKIFNDNSDKRYIDETQLKVLFKLIQKSNGVNWVIEGWSPLCLAIYNGDVALTELLLTKGADPDHKIKTKDICNGWTPLGFAVLNEKNIKQKHN